MANATVTASLENFLFSPVASDLKTISNAGKSTFFAAYHHGHATPDSPAKARDETGSVHSTSTSTVSSTSPSSPTVCPLKQCICRLSGHFHAPSSPVTTRARSKSSGGGIRTGSDSDSNTPTSEEGSRRKLYFARRRASTLSDPSAGDDGRELPDRIKQFEQKLVEDVNFRTDFLNHLLAEHASQGNIKLRFVIAVLEFQATVDKKSKAVKGTKVVSLFVKPSSPYRLSVIPHDVEMDLLRRSRLSSLVVLKQQVLESLLAEQATRQFLDRDHQHYQGAVRMM